MRRSPVRRPDHLTGVPDINILVGCCVGVIRLFMFLSSLIILLVLYLSVLPCHVVAPCIHHCTILLSDRNSQMITMLPVSMLRSSYPTSKDKQDELTEE